MLVLALAGVPAEEIAADYMLSGERLPAKYAARGEPAEDVRGVERNALRCGVWQFRPVRRGCGGRG